MLATARALGEFGAVAVVSGKLSGETETATLFVEQRFQNFDLTGAYAASMVLAILALATLLAMNLISPRREEEVTPMAIKVENVCKRFGDFVALDDVSLDVPEGCLTALLGPSGSGKSTLLRVIAGLEEPDTGSVEILGEDATGLAPQKRGVGFVFQHYAAFKHMTVEKNVAFGLSIRKRPKQEVKRRVAELLELVHLEGSPTATRASCRAASASAWRSRGRSRWSPRCCCSTSRSARWTRGCARTCASGCGGCTTRCT